RGRDRRGGDRARLPPPPRADPVHLPRPGGDRGAALAPAGLAPGALSPSAGAVRRPESPPPYRTPHRARSIMAVPTATKPANLPAAIQHYIGGSHVDSLDGDTFDVLDPVSNRPYLKAASGRRADVDAAVAAAKDAYETGAWPHMLPRERSRVLHRIADAVESRAAEPGAMECYDTGLPITQALGQARRAAENFRFFADLVVAQHDDAFKVPGRQANYVNRKPIGVAGLITPWNTPFMLESWKLAPA